MLLSGGTDTLADSGAAAAAVARLRANGTIFRRVVVASAEWLPQKGAKMTELRIDAGKAERIITQILRDEKGIPPADAVAVAVSICLRLAAAMPTSPSLDRYRIIPREPPDGDVFAIAVAKKLTEGKSELWNASQLWELVYNQGRHLRAN